MPLFCVTITRVQEVLVSASSAPLACYAVEHNTKEVLVISNDVIAKAKAVALKEKE